LVGYLEAGGGRYRRERHTAYLVVSILQEFTERGVGTRLFQAVETWARESGLHRLELTVMTHNQAGLALYRKMGFQVEGTRRAVLRVKGAWVDEYYMGKVLAAGHQ
jgi:RimJ/RimL family protein N-acetyltransferase